MPGIIEFPTIFQQAVEQFGSAFANEPERHHIWDSPKFVKVRLNDKPQRAISC